MLRIDNQHARSRQQLGLDQIQAFLETSRAIRFVVSYCTRTWIGDHHVWKNQVATKRLIGVVLQRLNLDFALTGKEILLSRNVFEANKIRVSWKENQTAARHECNR